MIQSSGSNSSSRPSHMRPFDKRQLSTLVDMESPEAVHKEVQHILSLLRDDFDTTTVDRVFKYTVMLYEGQLEEYNACNTDYHDLRHITDTYLAMARLLHGAQLSGKNFNDREIVLGLTGALMHDTGMIQEAFDNVGTGAKYTQHHVRLSMDFVTKHAETFQFSGQDVTDLRDILLCTDLMADISTIDFPSPAIELLGKILATADLIAQMADRTYLEKLLFLYHEFREAELGDFKNEVDFLHQTQNFFEISRKRFNITLDDSNRFMVPHFKKRWDIEENIYLLCLEKHRLFLEKIMADENTSVYEALKRDNIVQQVRQKFGDIGLGE